MNCEFGSFHSNVCLSIYYWKNFAAIFLNKFTILRKLKANLNQTSNSLSQTKWSVSFSVYLCIPNYQLVQFCQNPMWTELWAPLAVFAVLQYLTYVIKVLQNAINVMYLYFHLVCIVSCYKHYEPLWFSCLCSVENENTCKFVLTSYLLKNQATWAGLAAIPLL